MYDDNHKLLYEQFMKAEQPAHPPTIVVIEDDPSVSVLLTRHLERQGWAVRAAISLSGARELLRTAEWDLVLLDRRLPDGDGIELCGELREAAPHGYILMLTGESSEQAKLEGFGRGADDYVTKPFQIDELMARVRAGLRIVELQKALVASNRQLEELSLTDGLTNLRNRRAFDLEISSRFEQARRYQRPLSVAVIDVDFFKTVNDQHGHDAGDEVLRGVADVLGKATRGTDSVARYGGEEFAVILPETQLSDAIQFAEKIRNAIAESIIPTSESLHAMTVSIGVANVPYSELRSPDELVRAADQALYRAKNNGRNRVEAERRKAQRDASHADVRPAFTRLRLDRRSLQP